MNLKSILLLLVCGVACSLAQSECSISDLIECNKMRELEKKVPKTEAEMDDYCLYEELVLQCGIDVIEKCPKLTYFLEDHKQGKKILKKLCDKNDEYRKVALDNAACIVKHVETLAVDCPWKEDAKTHSEMCDQLKKLLKCQVDKMVEGCGEGIRKFYTFVQNSKYILGRKFCF